MRRLIVILLLCLLGSGMTNTPSVAYAENGGGDPVGGAANGGADNAGMAGETEVLRRRYVGNPVKGISFLMTFMAALGTFIFVATSWRHGTCD